MRPKPWSQLGLALFILQLAYALPPGVRRQAENPVEIEPEVEEAEPIVDEPTPPPRRITWMVMPSTRTFTRFPEPEKTEILPIGGESFSFQPMKTSNNRITRFFPMQVRPVVRQSSTDFAPSGGSFSSGPAEGVQRFQQRNGPVFQADSNFEMNDPAGFRGSSIFHSERSPPLSGTLNTAKISSFDADENDPNPPQVHTSVSSAFIPNTPGARPIPLRVHTFEQQPQEDQGEQFPPPEDGQPQPEHFAPAPMTRPSTFSTDDTTDTDDGGEDQNKKSEEESSGPPTAEGPDGKISESSHVAEPGTGHHLLAGAVQSDTFGSFHRSPTSIGATTFDSKGMDSAKKMSTAVHETPDADLVKQTQESRHRAEDQQTSSSFIDDTELSHKKFESQGSHSAWHTHRSRHKTSQPTEETQVFRLGTGKGSTTTFGRTSATTFLGLDTPTTEGKRFGNKNDFSTQFMDFDPTHFMTSRSARWRRSINVMESEDNDKRPLIHMPPFSDIPVLANEPLEIVPRLPQMSTIMPLLQPKPPVAEPVCRDLLVLFDTTGTSPLVFKRNRNLVKQIVNSAILPWQKVASLIAFSTIDKTKAVAKFEERLDNLGFMRRIEEIDYFGGVGDVANALKMANDLIAKNSMPVDVIFVSDGYSSENYTDPLQKMLANDANRFFVLAPNHKKVSSQLSILVNSQNIYNKFENLEGLRDNLAC